MARRLIALAAAGLIGISLTGCVSQDKYNALKMEKDQLAEQLGSSEAAAASAKASADSWKSQLDRLIANSNDKDGLAGALGKELNELKVAYASLDEKYKHALDDKVQFSVVQGQALPQAQNDELQRFAQEHPELVEFDAARGILRFKSDVTFAKGSAELTPNARQAIGQLASLLNGGIFTKYEFLVAGHTDSTPVSNPATIAAGHKDNWYLSAHRSIAVGSALSRDGISPRRLGVLGYADQRPIASNSTSEGMAKNRRVEIVVLPITYHGGTTVVDVPAPTHNVGRTTRVVTPVKRSGAGELNKDSAFNDTRPIIGNK